MSKGRGHDNNAFVGDNPSIPGDYKIFATKQQLNTNATSINDELNNKATKNNEKNESNNEDNVEDITATDKKEPPHRGSWGKGIEFLLSCIAMSVGLGNVWRFPFTALENGGGAFLIPYLIILFLVGRPIYYMEMLIGQFSSRGNVKMYDFAPAMRGIGVGQVFSVALLATYYGSLMALISHYMIKSFSTTLPWSYCKNDWVNCINSAPKNNSYTQTNGYYSGGVMSSSEYYFLKDVLKEVDSIDDGIGLPDLSLSLCLAFAWFLVFLILIKGIKSSGKASYFLALFPYVVIGILLVRACTLPGAIDGIIFFIKPQWDQILNPKVWYAAVTQVFFSLSVCFGNIIMYASYNKFTYNITRDVNIVTSLDTITSLLAGCTIFGILGHLAHQIGTKDIALVVKGGTGLAFISYPDAIAKFEVLPQVFSVLFFLMLFVLGIGSNVAITSCIMTAIRDKFPHLKHWHAATVVVIIGFLLGLTYVTPGGQYILNLVDYFGASFIVFVLAIAEIVAVVWIYGITRFCKDVEFMLGKYPGFYWRFCWAVVTPLLLISILVYSIATMEPITYKDYVYPPAAYAFGWCLATIGMLQLPIWAFYAIVKQNGATLQEKIYGAFKPTKAWGPADPATNERYKKSITTESDGIFKQTGLWNKIKSTIF